MIKNERKKEENSKRRKVIFNGEWENYSSSKNYFFSKSCDLWMKQNRHVEMKNSKWLFICEGKQNVILVHLNHSFSVIPEWKFILEMVFPGFPMFRKVWRLCRICGRFGKVSQNDNHKEYFAERRTCKTRIHWINFSWRHQIFLL